MAVFTKLAHSHMQSWLKEYYAITIAGEAEPIAEGIENSNYRIYDVNGSEFILTIIEKWDFPNARYCIDLATHFNQAGLPVPYALPNLAKCRCSELEGKPAVIAEFVHGANIPNPSASHCQQFGSAIAKLHAAAGGFARKMANPRNHGWRMDAASKMRVRLPGEQQQLLDNAMKIDTHAAAAKLDVAACHCDLFRNNVLWEDGSIAGIIDFYFAGDDSLGFDFGVAAIDWSLDSDGKINLDLLAALCKGYCAQAGRLPADATLMVELMIVGALRFWLSRLVDIHEPREAVMLTPHDPEVFRVRLQACLEHQDELGKCFASAAP